MGFWEGVGKIGLGIGCIVAAPVVAVGVMHTAAAAGVVAMAAGATKAAVVGAGVAATVATERAVIGAGVAKIAEGGAEILD